MSDLELLKNAARACGYEWDHDIARFRTKNKISGLWVYHVSTAWDPLSDSGHALALAVKLRLDIRHASGLVYVGRISNDEWFAHESHGDDAEQATRLAIVRAAAALGISMFGQRDNSCDREEEDQAPYCHECGSEDLAYLEQYATGREYMCRVCGKAQML